MNHPLFAPRPLLTSLVMLSALAVGAPAFAQAEPAPGASNNSSAASTLRSSAESTRQQPGAATGLRQSRSTVSAMELTIGAYLLGPACDLPDEIRVESEQGPPVC
jgi:hypothetical protein